MKAKGSYIDRELWAKVEGEALSLQFDRPTSFSKVKLIEDIFEKIISDPERNEHKKELYVLLRKEQFISPWDLVTWGERNFFKLSAENEALLIGLGEDNYYRSFVIASLGTILSVLHGVDDLRFLKSLFHMPFILDALYLNNSLHRQKQFKRPGHLSANGDKEKDFIRLLQSFFPGIQDPAIFFYALNLAVNYIGTDDEDHMDSLSSIEVIFHKLEKLTPMLIRFFDASQWDFFKTRVLTSKFFQLSNKSFFRGVG